MHNPTTPLIVSSYYAHAFPPNSPNVLSSSGVSGCCRYFYVKNNHADNPNGGATGTFAIQAFGVKVDSKLFNNPDPVGDYDRCHANAGVNGQFFSPNGGRTWFQVFYIKTPYTGQSVSTVPLVLQLTSPTAFTRMNTNCLHASSILSVGKMLQYIQSNAFVVQALESGEELIWVITGLNYAYSNTDKVMQLQSIYVPGRPFVTPPEFDLVGTYPTLGPDFRAAIERQIKGDSSGSEEELTTAQAAAPKRRVVIGGRVVHATPNTTPTTRLGDALENATTRAVMRASATEARQDNDSNVDSESSYYESETGYYEPSTHGKGKGKGKKRAAPRK